MKSLRAFLATIASDVIGRMSGGAGLLLTVLGFYSPSSWQPKSFFFVGVVCLFVACYRAWLSEGRQREVLLRELAPRLAFVRDPGVKPFFEELPLGPDGPKERFMRVGIRNLGGVAIPQARIVLEGCEPGSSPAVHPEHELQPMGRLPGTLTVAIPAHGTVFTDVAYEMVGPGEDRGELHLCYARGPGGRLPPMGEDGRYTLILRAEGAGQPARCSTTLGGRLPWRMDALTPLGEA